MQEDAFIHPYPNYKVRLNLFLTLFFLLTLSGSSLGQSFKPRMEVFPRQSYGESEQVFCAKRGPEGGIWFGSVGALPYFNGEEWEKLSTEGMALFDIEHDEKGRIWIAGHGNFGYLKRPEDPLSIEWADSSTSQAYLTPDSLTREEGKFQVGLHLVSLTHLVPDSLQTFDIIHQVHAFEDMVFFNGNIALFTLDNNGLDPILPRSRFLNSFRIKDEVWVQDHGHGLYSIGEEDLRTTDRDRLAESTLLKGSEALADKEVQAIHPRVPGITEKGECLVVTRTSGLFLFRKEPNPGEDHVQALKNEALGATIEGIRISSACPLIEREPSNGPDAFRSNPWNASLVLNTRTEGLILLNDEAEPVLQLDRKDGLPSNNIWHTTRGAPGSGILWSSTNNGIVRWDLGDPRVHAKEGDEPLPKVEALARYRDMLLVATDKGLYQAPVRDEWKERNVEWKLLIEKQVLEIRTPDPKKQKGGVLLGTDKLYSLNWQDGEPFQRQVTQRTSHAFASCEFRNRGTYVLHGGKDGIGLLKRGTPDQKWKKLLHIDELPEKRLRSLALEPLGKGLRLWTGTRTEGALQVTLSDEALNRLEKRSGKGAELAFPSILEEEAGGLSGERFNRKGFPLSVDLFRIDGRIVAGTFKGIFKPTKSGPNDTLRMVPDSSFGARFAGIAEFDAREFPQVVDLRKGKDGSVWLKADQLYHLVPENDTFQIRTAPFKGMGIGRINAFHPDENGITFIGGNRGLIRYHGKVNKEWERDYSCLLRKVTASFPSNGEQERKDSILFNGFSDKESPGDRSVGRRVSLKPEPGASPQLPYSVKRLRFRYAAPFFERSEALVYKAKLEGYDQDWTDWEKKIEKEYTGLPEGRYTFKVKARNVYGKESEPAKYRFEVLPPWYRTWPAYAGFSVAGIGFIWLLVWLNGRRLQAQKEHLEKVVNARTQEIRKQKETIEEAHAEITQSIDYAQKIQHALLQSEEHVSPHLPEHFILLKPQSQVSGDFYWAKEHKGYFYIAAVDCTGHGVPGAFMSMLGISQLNEIMNTDEVPTPGEILTQLRDRVVRELSGSDPESAAKDGMDAALVRIPLGEIVGSGQLAVGSEEKHSLGEGFNPHREEADDDAEETVNVQFAGAQNPLYVIRKGIAGDGDLTGHDRDLTGFENLSGLVKPFKKTPDGIEIKGDHMPVGYAERAENAFATVSLKLQKGDMLYIFSDGYADQFGGPKGKKFRYGPFKRLLASLHEKPLEEQKRDLEKTFEDWKDEGQQEQIDDVLLIGIRV